MKKNVTKSVIILFALIFMLTGCSSKIIERDLRKVTKANPQSHEALQSLPEAPDGNVTRIDIGSYDVSKIDLSKYEDLLYQVRFNTRTVWPEKLPGKFNPDKIIELGKDPGLHVRDLHAKGIDGRGISIGIIDVTLFTEHKEYKDNLMYYEDIPKSEIEFHMHGPAVASLAVGKTTGVAPGSKLYFIEASWEDEENKGSNMTYKYYAKGIHRLLDLNKELSEEEKIKVISISANPGADRGVSNYEDYVEAVERAKEEGVFIIAVSSDVDYGFRFGGLGRNPLGDPNDISSYYATDVSIWKDEGRIFFPMGSRSFASYEGDEDYSWIRSGGASWVTPYIAGLYAMALQVNPEVTPDSFWKAIQETADVKMDTGYKKNILIANPVNLINRLSGKAYSVIVEPEETEKALSDEEMTEEVVSNQQEIEEIEAENIILKPYDNITQLLWPNTKGNVFEENQYKAEDIYTYNFDSTNVFKGNEALAAEILEEGKDPGLGIRNLHKQGVTGKNVNVAIIDQHLLTDHPEFEGRIMAYYDSGTNTSEDEGSYHAPSVTSILGGKTIGIAPDVNIYYASAPSWEKDAKYFADSLYWIIEQNKALPESEKIRLVSVSAAPTSKNNWYKNGELWEEAVLAAQEEGIMVIDCRSGEDTSFVFSSYYDLGDKDNVTKCTPGYPDKEHDDFTNEYWQGTLFAPASFRTLARQIVKGQYGYRYDGKGGESWAVPYVSGVLALGWQVRPELDWETMKALLFESSWVSDQGIHFIDPPAFIEAVNEYN